MNQVATKQTNSERAIQPAPGQAVMAHEIEGNVVRMEGADISMSVALAGAEIDTQIATAHKYKRSIQLAIDNITTLATLDEETAESCMYSLPRGGKVIEGASIRMAELIAQQWGNNRVAARVVEVNRHEKYVECEGIYWDLETNSGATARVRGRLVDKNGKLYNEDMILMTANATNSKAKRNAILAGVPRPIWGRAYQAARDVVRGDMKTLGTRRADMFKAFQQFGLTKDQIFLLLNVKGEADIGLDLFASMKGMYQALKSGEETAESLLGAIEHVGDKPVSDKRPERKAKDKKAPKEGDGEKIAGETEREAKTVEEMQKPAGADASKKPSEMAGGAVHEPGTDGVDPETGEVTELGPPEAMEMGRKARTETKASLNSVPDMWRAPEMQHMAEAWKAGWRDADEEITKQQREAQKKQ